ncbi:hypothetical protein MMC07_003646 [Pseudocyphellaria aurata]|nr:hypothetical protein [Pseudocyphellaria aurata]
MDSSFSTAPEKVDSILSDWDPVKHKDIHAVGSSLKKLHDKITTVLNLEADVQAELKSEQERRDFPKMTRNLINAWCQSYLDIERVLLCVLEVFGITFDPSQENDAGGSFHQRVLATFDLSTNPVREILGSQNPLATEVFWSGTWKDAMAEEPAVTGRNPTREAIDTLRQFRELWPSSESAKELAPEFHGLKIAPPENYGVWFDYILKDLISALEICHKAKLVKLGSVVAIDKQTSTKESKLPATPLNELATSSATIGHVADPQASILSSPSGSLPADSLRLRQEVFSLRKNLNKTIRERDSARDGQAQSRWERDVAWEQLYHTRLQLDEAQALLRDQEAKIVRASKDAEEETWSKVRAALASDLFFDLVRHLA